MSDRDRINRRDFIVTTAGVAGTASAFAEATVTAAQAQAPGSPPPGVCDQEPFAKYWGKQLREGVDGGLVAAAPRLGNEAGQEGHQNDCPLLLELMVRFW